MLNTKRTKNNQYVKYTFKANPMPSFNRHHSKISARPIIKKENSANGRLSKSQGNVVSRSRPDISFNRTWLPKEKNTDYLLIKNPIIKEMTEALLKSEKARINNRIGSNKLTLVEHKNYSILFSKNGSEPLNNRLNSGFSTYESKFFNRRSKSSDSEDEKVLMDTKRSSINSDRNFLLRYMGLNYYVSEIYNETTGVLNRSPKTVDLNVETRKAIYGDLKSSPFTLNDLRSYKIEVNGNAVTRQTQVLKLLVCAEPIERQSKHGDGKLPMLMTESRSKKVLMSKKNKKSEPNYKFLDLDEIV